MTVLFDAKYARRGLREYQDVVNPQRITVVDDPLYGPGRKVVHLETRDEDFGLTENPRAQMEAQSNLVEGMEIFVGWSTLIPEEYPTLRPGIDWLSIQGVFGPPYGANGPMNIVAVDNGDGKGEVFTFSRTEAGVDKGSLPLRRGVWNEFVLHLKISADPLIGFAELYTRTGEAGWRNTLINGEVIHKYATLAAGMNDGAPNNARLGHYRGRGQWESAVIYHADHKVATTFLEATTCTCYLRK